MSRILRLSGIVLFALTLVFSSQSLREMGESGKLFERYNSQRKASMTLFGISMAALVGLSAFEIRRLRQPRVVHKYGRIRYTDQVASEDNEQHTSNIYAVRKSVDEWSGRRVSGSRSRDVRSSSRLPAIWLVMLRVTCLAIPFASTAIFSIMYLNYGSSSTDSWIIPAAGSIYVLLAIATAIGVIRRRAWGMTVGYITAILNLVIFPFGTVMGFFLLIGLVGASEAFEPVSRKSGKRLQKRLFA